VAGGVSLLTAPAIVRAQAPLKVTFVLVARVTRTEGTVSSA